MSLTTAIKIGIGLGMGFILGLTFAILTLIFVIGVIKGRKKLKDFKAEHFEAYKKKLEEAQNYEELIIVDAIIKDLKKGHYNTQYLKLYKLKKNVKFKMDDETEFIKIDTQYEIVKKEENK